MRAPGRPWLKALVVLGLIIGISAWYLYYLSVEPPRLRAANRDFLVEPYLQLGESGDAHRPQLVWAASITDADWKVEVATSKTQWQPAKINEHPITLANMPAFRLFTADLPALPEGIPIPYRVSKGAAVVFASEIRALKPDTQAYRVDVVGDIASGTPAQRAMARQLYDSHADMVVIPGDIVYNYGRTLEYLARFFPVYNADSEPDGSGVPLLRQTLMVAAPGNHDTGYAAARTNPRNLDEFPDGLGYFLWWKQPLNGPDVASAGQDMPVALGSAQRRKEFLLAAGNEYPQEENFSFDFENAHWTILDANDYMDWTHPRLRQWLEKDLASAKSSTWKFVVFHQTCFSSDPHHFTDQQMRLIADILQDNKVDIVFAGHTHNYQRTYPLKFQVNRQSGAMVRNADGTVPGKFQLDKVFDGKTNTVPDGVIYITTGGGGAQLYFLPLPATPDQLQPFTAKFIARHSFTQCDIDNSHLHIRQIAADGSLLDELSVEKPRPSSTDLKNRPHS